MKLTQIWQYPIKSCQGIQLQEGMVGEEGLVGDRRFQLILPNGRFVTQREFPHMANIAVQLNKQSVDCFFNEQKQEFDFDDFKQQETVKIWGDKVKANILIGSGNEKLSKWMGMDVRLAQLPPRNRPISDKAAEGFVSFADGFPYLLIGQASLDDLNVRLDKKVTMKNFRPNLVVDSMNAFEEDGWNRLQIGDVIFRNVKPCSRCVLTTVDPSNGKKAKDLEPLKTLAMYRKFEQGKIMFGVNLIAENTGQVKLGQQAILLD